MILFTEIGFLIIDEFESSCLRVLDNAVLNYYFCWLFLFINVVMVDGLLFVFAAIDALKVNWPVGPVAGPRSGSLRGASR